MPHTYDLTRVLDLEDEQKLLAHLAKKDQRDLCAAMLCLKAGLRIGEMLALQVGDVLMGDLVAKEVLLRAGTTKRHKPRWIPLHAELRKTLLHFLRWKKQKGESMDPEAPLICNRKGDRPYGARDFERHLQAAGYLVLHRRVVPLDLRHTFATRLSRKGNLPALQQLLGHASLESTQAYTHPNREDLLKLVEEA
jgi:integrase